ncbi:unnamed protein product [Effrenium voratum]|uniref:NADP-dependent oxidoreductase domain-containing protein n=1 Tax=Effrenium voratum TaxID=2562239 RepID=A0AA36I6A0_9DINO|nr:unnamed protein product [Effrenium voratum]CAJ1433313.1 unnamed protein product [Effrenium voratum]
MSLKLMPRVAFGCWELPAGQVEDVVYEAIKAGYRHIDSAEIYGNEVEVGKAFARAFAEKLVTRADLFICSKLWATDWSQVRAACEKSIAALQCEYLDLYLIHTPIGFDTSAPKDANGKTARAKIPVYRVWADMESLVDAKLCRHIGVSNFSCLQIADIQTYAKHPIACNQLEIHPSYPNRALADWCLSQGVAVVCYCPLGAGKTRDIELPALKAAGAGAEKGAGAAASPALAALRWALDKNYHVITKSTNPERMKANLLADCDSWSLSPEHTAAIDAVAGTSMDMAFKICNHAEEFGLPLYH